MNKKTILLEKYVKSYLEDNVSLSNYNLDFEKFDNEKKLFDYQMVALKYITRLLIKYFDKDGKKEILKYYESELDNELKEELNLNKNNIHFELMKNYYDIENKQISYQNFLNRASFWMATGSGKTLIIIKLIEILYELMSQGLIPEKKVLIITPNDDIFNQIQKHVDEFNDAKYRYKKIFFRDIKDYEEREFAGLNPLQPDSMTVYHTRTTVLSNKSQEKMIDYSSYIENDGWYVILDEAHKGKEDESLRKQYLNILSKNGFMFNFSATFVDNLDIVSTISNFNLPTFINEGYGKNIKVLNEEFKNFKAKNNKELDDKEKKEIILKSLIVFTAIKKNYTEITKIDQNLYHNPLMLTISNEINTKNADMKLYFSHLSDIAAGKVNESDLRLLKKSIIKNLDDNIKYTIGDEELSSQIQALILSVTYQDILQCVYNSESPGEIEVYQIGVNNNELSFRLKTSNQSSPFAIIKASDVNKWKSNILEDYTFNQDVVTSKSRFKDIHKKNNGINILMGSRQFIEGWDSNRPNIINFINMGTNDENTKLILQAIGRGVRIEPQANVRKRFKLTEESIINFEKQERNKIIKYGQILETLFIFATNKQVVSNIIKELNFQDDKWNHVAGIKKTKMNELLQVPVYRTLNYNDKKFKIGQLDYNIVNDYVTSMSEKLLIVRDDFKYETIKNIKNKESISIIEQRPTNKKPYELIREIESHMSLKSQVLIGFREEVSQVDIKHYKHIQTTYSGEDLYRLEEYIKESLLDYKDNYSTSKQYELVNDLITIYQEGKEPSSTMKEISKDMGIVLDNVLKTIDEMDLEDKLGVELRRLQTHYYQPLIISHKGKFKHTIKEQSEIEFIREIEEYTKSSNAECNKFDWWFFSKLSESTDEIYIPYYDNEKQVYREFYPDFIFWLKKNNKYFIKFVDPKGLRLSQQNALDKIKGFEEVFLDNNSNVNKDINVDLLYFYQHDSGDEKLEQYRFSDVNKIFQA